MKTEIKDDVADSQEIRRQKEELKNSHEEMATWSAGRIIEKTKDDENNVRD